MKKLIVSIITLLVAGISFAYGPGWMRNASPEQKKVAWEQRQKMHDLRHYATIKTEKIDKGVSITITSSEAEVVTTIKKEFYEKKSDLQKFYKGAKISTKLLKNGTALTLTATDKKLVEEMQYLGNVIVFRYLHGQSYAEHKAGNFTAGKKGVRKGYGFGIGQGHRGPGYPCERW